MKKYLALPIVFFIIVSFKIKNNTDSRFEDCKTLEEYKTITDIDEQAKWLKNNEDLFCSDIDILKFSFDEHTVTDTNDFNNRIKNKPSKSFNWVNEIEPKIKKYKKNYEAYMTFKFDANNKITDIDFITDFQKTPSCYSLACIKGAYQNALKNAKSEHIEFKFYVESKDKVLFEVLDNNPNYSQPLRRSQNNISDKPLSVKGDLYLNFNGKLKKIEKNNLKKNNKLIKKHNLINSPI